jgi:hypothetical protein
MNKQQILNDLKKEITETLFFFLITDLQIYGKVTQATKKAFEAQKVTLPAIFSNYC